MASTVSTKEDPSGNALTSTWVLESDDGTAGASAVRIPGAADRTVQFVSADHTGIVAVLEGSNDGTNWSILTDPQGNAIQTAGSNMLKLVSESPLYIRARLTTAGTDKSITIILVSRVTNHT